MLQQQKRQEGKLLTMCPKIIAHLGKNLTFIKLVDSTSDRCDCNEITTR